MKKEKKNKYNRDNATLTMFSDDEKIKLAKLKEKFKLRDEPKVIRHLVNKERV